jgi:hypothetical protein
MREESRLISARKSSALKHLSLTEGRGKRAEEAGEGRGKRLGQRAKVEGRSKK